jgi:phosphatidylserine decarboxylase
MAFESVHEATRLWIKGRDFTIQRLLGEAYEKEAERYNGGALVIFRLAPQDYHRFHSPVDGVIGPMTCISGEYYTVNVSYSFAFQYSFIPMGVIHSLKPFGLLWMFMVTTFARSFRSIVLSSVA